MRIAIFCAVALCAGVLTTHPTLAEAPEFQAILTFELPAATSASQTNPACRRALDTEKLLSNPQWHKALLDVDAHATRIFESTTAVLKQLGEFGAGAQDPVVRTAFANSSQCESGCVVLPRGARLKATYLTDRHGSGAFSILEGDERLRPPKYRTDSTLSTRANASFTAADFGYQDIVVSGTDRIVCVTAKNWSLVEPATQIVSVVFDR